MSTHTPVSRILGVLTTCLLTLALGGCFASEGQLRMKAASEFDCDKDSLVVTDAGSGVYEVSGCGQEQRYVYREDAKAWLRESDAGGKVIDAPPPLGAAASEP